MYSKFTVDEPVQKEYSTYFVNGIACKRDDIYKNILANKFYSDQVMLEKKSHFSHKEEVTNKGHFLIIDGARYEEVFREENKSESLNSNFGLNTKKFAAKVNPESEEYKHLIDQMISVLDMFSEAQKHYDKYLSNKLKATVCDCVILANNLNNSPYDGILSQSAAEQTAFMFDMMAFGLAYTKVKNNASKHTQLPSLNFEMSSLESWDETWEDSKKSHVLNKYFSLLLNQLNDIHQHWKMSEWGFGNKIDYKFDEFKEVIQSLQEKKSSIDLSLLDIDYKSTKYTSTYNSFFDKKQCNKPNDEVLGGMLKNPQNWPF